MSKINFIACVNWVKKGVAKEVPEKVDLNKDELKRLIEEARQNVQNLEDEEEEMNVSENGDERDNGDEGDNEDESFIRRYNLDNYDNDDDTDNTALSLANITVHASNDEDPYLEQGSDESDEEDNFKINPNDNLVLVGHVENEVAQLEVYVYNHENDDLYVHHDIILPAFPICFECIGYGVGSENESVNYVAVGDMTKDICIWDLDLVNTLEPVAKLVGHKDSVLDLSWNHLVTQTIASGSVDHTVSLWDLNTHKSVESFSKFKSNVQSLKFHPNEAQTLLIGDCNGAVSIFDCQSGAFKKWTLVNEEIEKVIWNDYNPYLCFAGTSNGSVYCFDVRNDKKFIYTFKAHNQLISGLSLSSSCPGCLITSSSDKTVKVWDVDEKQAEFVHEFSNLKLGSVLGLSSNPDFPFVIALGGDSKCNNFRILDISSSKKIQAHFTSRFVSKNE